MLVRRRRSNSVQTVIAKYFFAKLHEQIKQKKYQILKSSKLNSTSIGIKIYLFAKLHELRKNVPTSSIVCFQINLPSKQFLIIFSNFIFKNKHKWMGTLLHVLFCSVFKDCDWMRCIFVPFDWFREEAIWKFREKAL
jgi:hypothetical protein